MRFRISGIAKRVTIKRLWGYFGTAAVLLLMLLSLTVLFAPRLGWQVDTVLSGSMSPNMEVGSVVVSRPVDANTIELGDVITYRSPQNGKLTTHRVAGIEENSPLYFQTKGDANENPDNYLVPAANIEGKVVFNMPYIGYAADFVKTPLGFCLMLGLPGLIIIVTQMRKMWIELAEEEKRKKAQVKNYV